MLVAIQKKVSFLLKITFIIIFASGFDVANGLAADPKVNKYEQDIKNLADGTPKEMIKASFKNLIDGGTDAFPKLLLHLNDSEPAEWTFFAEEKAIQRQDGSWEIATPTIGTACFGILQRQIEGFLPKGYRHFYVLTIDNVSTWLDAHKGQTLQELREAAKAEALRRAEKELLKDPDNEFLKTLIIPFLKKAYEEKLKCMT